MLPLKQVVTQFPNWTFAQCKAYRAGALAGVRGKHISEGFEYDDDEDDDLTCHYLRGYADAIGTEANGCEWFDEISDWSIQERWWDVIL